MKPFNEMSYHPTTEQLVKVICDRVQNNSPHFFRVHVAYYFAVVAAMMRCQVATQDRGNIPVNSYAINLAPSGFGKGYSTNIIEEEVIKAFTSQFIAHTFPTLAEQNLPVIANTRAQIKGTDPDEELERARKEFDDNGSMETVFSSATGSAIKQFRHKLLMANSGSINFQVDEIGSNLTGEVEALTAFLELYDAGRIKNSLRKNTAENRRNEHLDGCTPTNMMLFGTQAKLMDGGRAEEELYSMLETGYARRSLFGFERTQQRPSNRTAEAVLDLRINKQSSQFIDGLSRQLAALADPVNAHRKLTVSREVSLLFIEYQLDCEARASDLPEHADLRKAELSHRHSKAAKLAGAYAFVDGSPVVTEDHAYYAIKLVEDSGNAFLELLHRERPHVKLAKYLADVGRKVTHADLVEDLAYYPKSSNQRNDMLALATAYGYQNNIIIKKQFTNSVEFLQGEALQPTELDKLVVSYSQDIAQGYRNELAPWDKLHLLTQNAGLHWVNHHVQNGHRQDESCIPGFNMVVLDVDHGINLSTAKLLLENYKALFYTTKRHTNENPRFRIILPTNYTLKLELHDFKQFMKNLFESIPFEVDSQTGQRARKWLSHNGAYEYQDGELFDVLPFIPQTAKDAERKELLKDQQEMDNLERWVINSSGEGNRNNQLLRYALVLVDAGFDFEGVRSRVSSLNEKMIDKLTEAELLGTVMVTVGKKLSQK